MSQFFPFYYVLDDGDKCRAWPFPDEKVERIMEGPFSIQTVAKELAHAFNIAAANKLPELDDFFQHEGEWFAERFELTAAEYADLVENQEAW